MKVLLVFAHPEPRSLNGALRDIAVEELRAQGHEVKVTDLHARGWKAHVDREDFPAWPADERLSIVAASKSAYQDGTLTEDVRAEIEKLLWADALILQFPMWWYGMPAILKGWVDRVYAYGFAYGVGEHSDRRWGDRFGEGTLAGRRAMVITTVGGWEPHYSPRGVNGPIEDLLFPINHGVLYYPGYEVLPAYVTYRVDRFGAGEFEAAAEMLRQRMRTLFTAAPIAYRQQNGGDYEIPSMQLKPDLETPGASGFALHVANPVKAGAPSLPDAQDKFPEGRPDDLCEATR